MACYLCWNVYYDGDMVKNSIILDSFSGRIKRNISSSVLVSVLVYPRVGRPYL